MTPAAKTTAKSTAWVAATAGVLVVAIMATSGWVAFTTRADIAEQADPDPVTWFGYDIALMLAEPAIVGRRPRFGRLAAPLRTPRTGSALAISGLCIALLPAAFILLAVLP